MSPASYRATCVFPDRSPGPLYGAWPLCSAELEAQLAQRGSSALQVYCSPLTRTLETAVLVAEHNDLLTTDARFQACISNLCMHQVLLACVGVSRACCLVLPGKDLHAAKQVVPELLERNFGAYELQSDVNYAKVWDADARSLQAAPPGGAESVEQVHAFPCMHRHILRDCASMFGPCATCISSRSCTHLWQVAERVRALFTSLEAANEGKDILLVSHGMRFVLVLVTRRDECTTQSAWHGSRRYAVHPVGDSEEPPAAGAQGARPGHWAAPAAAQLVNAQAACVLRGSPACCSGHHGRIAATTGTAS